jgi:hypothetical protein
MPFHAETELFFDNQLSNYEFLPGFNFATANILSRWL